MSLAPLVGVCVAQLQDWRALFASGTTGALLFDTAVNRINRQYSTYNFTPSTCSNTSGFGPNLVPNQSWCPSSSEQGATFFLFGCQCVFSFRFVFRGFFLILFFDVFLSFWIVFLFVVLFLRFCFCFLFFFFIFVSCILMLFFLFLFSLNFPVLTSRSFSDLLGLFRPLSGPVGSRSFQAFFFSFVSHF